jgi:SprT protein
MPDAARDDPDGDDTHLRERIHARVAELLGRAMALYPALQRRPLAPEIAFDLRGQAAGQASWRPGKPPLLRFNLVIARHYRDDFVTDTVAHEVAHLVTRRCHPHARPHGSEWKTVMRHFGIATPQRCHDYRSGSDAVRRQRRWLYTCGCRTHALSTTRHWRVQSQLSVYRCRQCGEILARANRES